MIDACASKANTRVQEDTIKRKHEDGQDDGTRKSRHVLGHDSLPEVLNASDRVLKKLPDETAEQRHETTRHFDVERHALK